MISEIALACVLLVGAGLLLRSFFKLLDVDRGFNTQRIVTVTVNLPNTRYPDREKRAAFLESLLDRVKALPGVTSAGVSNMLPLAGELREFELPRPIFTESEKTEWAPGVYANRHAELQVHVDITKVIKTPGSKPGQGAAPQPKKPARLPKPQTMDDKVVALADRWKKR